MRTVEVTDALQEYMDSLVLPRDKVLARMEEEAHREGIPIVDEQEGALLSLLVRIAGAKRVLELGTATGYSGIWLLRGTDGGTLTTYEMDRERARRARSNFSDAGLGDRALVLEEDAVKGLEKLDARFDVCLCSRRTSRRATCAATTSSWRMIGASKASSCRSATGCRSPGSGTDRPSPRCGELGGKGGACCCVLLRQVLIRSAERGEGKEQRDDEHQRANTGKHQRHVVRELDQVAAGQRAERHC
ncbi:MAG: hypothetical protein E6I42_06610 [Chloroflexi bacterium]|nr:MAG: hypothetical protein E6I42_06610 [Chloroflexota bacterium]